MATQSPTANSRSSRISCALCLRPRMRGSPNVKAATAGEYHIYEFGGMVPYELKGGELICRHHELQQEL